jgi:hypothetical protein
MQDGAAAGGRASARYAGPSTTANAATHATAALSSSNVGAADQLCRPVIRAAVSAAIPARSVRRRPIWSAIAPAVSSAAASPRLIALSAQVRQPTEAPNVAAVSWMVGTTVVKSISTSRVATLVMDASPTELPPGRPGAGMDLGKPLRFALVLLARADGESGQGDYGAPGEAGISLRSGTGMRRFGSRHR